MSIEYGEPKMIFDPQASLEKLPGVSEVQKIIYRVY